MTILTHGAVFAASLLQAATGIGFALVAGPVILIVFDSSTGVQLTMILSLAICAVQTPTMLGAIDTGMLRRLALGTLAGLPLGLVIFRAVDLSALKLMAACAVAFMALQAARATRRETASPGAQTDLAVGVLSGAMNTALAMPGPAAAARMTALALPKAAVRATVLALMTLSYVAAIAVQWAAVGIDAAVLSASALYLPAVAAGIVAGRAVAERIGETVFRRVIAGVLALMALALVGDVVQGAATTGDT